MPQRRRRGQLGLAYLALLIGVAIIGVAAAGTIQLGALYQRRMAEKELLYIGDQFQRALLSYADKTPLGLPTQPRTLDELVRDPRYPSPVRHLRRVYADPLTGKADWVLVLSPNGQTIVGIHSASREHPIQLRQFPERFRGFEDKRSYTQWVFIARPPQLAPGQRPPNSVAGGMPVPVPGVPIPVGGNRDGVQPGGGGPGDAGVSASGGFSSGEGFSNASEPSNNGGFSNGGGFSTTGEFTSGNGSTNGSRFSSDKGFSSGN
ncbi:type II secretion system protein [Paraburkholderia mimosarum]|uniref:type II secretion system protein n=2 Tax=Paraburkholderia mimosarum TaxID=312026 RepID=UPI0003FFA36C